MFKKTFLSIASSAALLGAVAAPASASSKFFLVVPLNPKAQVQEPAEAITVSLAGSALPKATVNQAYSESLRPYLSVTGDAAFDPTAARWSLAEGTLPAGLALDSNTGAVSGTPTAKTSSPASFTVLAAYKGQNGQAVYTIEVGGTVLNVTQIATGYNHTCVVTADGSAKCWGLNTYGQLGDNSTANRMTPVDVRNLNGVTALAAGVYHTCAVVSGGYARCWGYNNWGQLGDNSTTQRLMPVAVHNLSGVTALAVGGNHTCAMVAGGIAKCWGLNTSGQLGDRSTINRMTPVDVLDVQ